VEGKQAAVRPTYWSAKSLNLGSSANSSERRDSLSTNQRSRPPQVPSSYLPPWTSNSRRGVPAAVILGTRRSADGNQSTDSDEKLSAVDRLNINAPNRKLGEQKSASQLHSYSNSNPEPFDKYANITPSSSGRSKSAGNTPTSDKHVRSNSNPHQPSTYDHAPAAAADQEVIAVRPTLLPVQSKIVTSPISSNGVFVSTHRDVKPMPIGQNNAGPAGAELMSPVVNSGDDRSDLVTSTPSTVGDKRNLFNKSRSKTAEEPSKRVHFGFSPPSGELSQSLRDLNLEQDSNVSDGQLAVAPVAKHNGAIADEHVMFSHALPSPNRATENAVASTSVNVPAEISPVKSVAIVQSMPVTRSPQIQQISDESPSSLQPAVSHALKHKTESCQRNLGSLTRKGTGDKHRFAKNID
jgi:hypothetical protein